MEQSSANPFDCKHEQTELRKRRQSNGVLVVVRQCVCCGNNCGCVSKQTINLSALKEWNEQLREQWNEKRQRWWREEWEHRQQAESDEFWQRWHEHMASMKWQELRRKVLARCKNKCEGCGEAWAAQVHHLTYKHLGNEFLFELVALCHECHERLHDSESA